MDLARLMASMSTVKPVSARAAASEMSRPPGLSCCFLKSSSVCRMSGFLAWRSRAKKERVRCPSMSSFISSMNAGSTHPAFWAMSTLGA